MLHFIACKKTIFKNRDADSSSAAWALPPSSQNKLSLMLKTVAGFKVGAIKIHKAHIF